MSAFLDPIARSQACSLELWKAEARVSTQLTRVEASYQKDLFTRLREERALNVALAEVRRCLGLRDRMVKHRLAHELATAGNCTGKGPQPMAPPTAS